MPRKQPERGLGRGLGLGALFGEEAMLEAEKVTGTSTLPISRIEANSAQPRKEFRPEELEDLADSIRTYGLLEPVLVRQLASGYYQLISGERRWRAARMAELKEIPAIVIEADDKKALEIGLVENLQRSDLNPMEEAEGYQTLMDRYGLTQEEVAERVGKSRPAVANALRLIKLPEELKASVRSGALSSGHARALLPLSGEDRKAAAKQVEEEELSVRQTEALVKRLLNKKPEAVPEEDPDAVYYREAEVSLGSRLGRKVRITPGRKCGRLELEYYGMDDLNDLLDALNTLKKARGNGSADKEEN